MRRRATLHTNLVDARTLWREFLSFRNDYWFVEVTLRAQGDAIYDRFQRGLGAHTLYESMSDKVHQLQDYYEQQSQRSTDERLGFLTVVGALLVVPALLTQIYSVDLLQAASWQDLVRHCLVGYFGLLVVYAFWRLWVRLRIRGD